MAEGAGGDTGVPRERQQQARCNSKGVTGTAVTAGIAPATSTWLHLEVSAEGSEGHGHLPGEPSAHRPL